jgi:hypothetical protein
MKLALVLSIATAACWHEPPRATTGPAGSPGANAALGRSPCDGVSVHDITANGAPAVPVPNDAYDGGRREPVFAGTVGDRVVVITTTPTLVASIYEPRVDRWTQVTGDHTPAPDRVDFVRPFVAGSRVVLVWEARDPKHVIQIDVLDVTRGVLRAMPLANSPATFNSRVAYAHDSLLVWEGDPNTYPPPIDFARGSRFDFKTWSWSELPADGAPSSRSYDSFAVAGDRVLVWGGMGPQHGSATNPVFRDGAIFDAAALAWRALDVHGAPSARYGASTHAWNDRVLVWGGSLTYMADRPSYASDAHVIDLATGRWHAARAGTPPRFDNATFLASPHSSTTIGRFLAVVTDDADGWAFDLEADRWDKLPAGPSPHSRRLVRLGERAFGWFGPVDTAESRLDVFDLVTRRWCAPAVGSSPAFEAASTAATWDGSSLGVWGAIDPVQHPRCPPGAPCMRWRDAYTSRAIGSVITW